MWIYFLIGTILIATGLAIHVLKWYFLISGYNTMPKVKKAKVDTAGLGRMMGLYGYTNGGLFVVMGVLNAIGLKPSLVPVLLFFGVSTLYLLIRSQRFDGNIFDDLGKLRPGAGRQLILPIALVTIILALVAVLMIFSSRPTQVTVADDGLRIHGLYGDLFTWETLEVVQIKETLPTIILRTNGSALGPILKGHFRTDEFGAVKLFINTRQPPFIYLETTNDLVIFNLEDEQKTVALYQAIFKRLDE